MLKINKKSRAEGCISEECIEKAKAYIDRYLCPAEKPEITAGTGAVSSGRLITPTDAGITAQPFAELTAAFMESRGMTAEQLCTAAGIGRWKLSGIISGNAFHPSKDVCIRICLALGLDRMDAKLLLSAAGYGLSHSTMRDLILEYSFDSRIFNINAVNELLGSMGEKKLRR